MPKRGACRIAAGVLLCAAGAGLLCRADTLTARLMLAAGADVVPTDLEYLPVDDETTVPVKAIVQRITRWSLLIHAVGFGFIGVGAWLQLRTLRRPQQPALDEQTQRLLAQWVLMRATLRHRLAAGRTLSWHNALSLKVLDYLVGRYKDPASARAVPASLGSTRSAAPHAPAAALFRPHRGARKPPKRPAAFRPALDEIHRLNIESYAAFGFSQRFRHNAIYN